MDSTPLGHIRFEQPNMKKKLRAILLATFTLLVISSVPHILGHVLWRMWNSPLAPYGRPLLQKCLSTIAVLVFIFVTGKAACLAPQRPRKPILILLLLPLIIVNVAKGPVVQVSLVAWLTILAWKFLTGFWEEFCFRQLILDQLSVLGPRLSIVIAAIFFSGIHWNRGVWSAVFAFSVGLVFSAVRDRIGMWPLVVIHFLIDFTSALFVVRWQYWNTVAKCVMIINFCLGVVLVIRFKDADQPADATGVHAEY